jgi:hypothetical protein
MIGLLVSVDANAQFVASVESDGFVLLQDSTYRGDLKKFTDQTNNNFKTSEAKVGYYLTDGNFHTFVLDTIHSVSFSSMRVTVMKIDSLKNFPPFGRGQLSEDLLEGFHGVVTSNDRGISQKLKGQIDTRSYKKTSDSLSLLLDNSIDSVKVKGDSVVIYYHRKGMEYINNVGS